MVALLFPPAVMTFTFNNSEVLMCAVLYVDTLSQIQPRCADCLHLDDCPDRADHILLVLF